MLKTKIKKSLPEYKTSEGYKCKTEAAMVAHVVKEIARGSKGHFIFVTPKNRAYDLLLTNAFIERRIAAIMHGGNVTIEPGVSLREAETILDMTIDITLEAMKAERG